MVIGHEAAGVVVEVGSGVRDLEPGDHVVMVFVPSCGACVSCLSGRSALCEPAASANVAGTLLSGGRRLSRKGESIHHHLGVSCFAEHCVVSRRSLIPIERDVPLERAALFGCAVLTGLGAVVNTAAVPAGSTVAVVGLGGVGLCALLGARLVGARRLVAIDLLDEKLALARELGATDTFHARDPDCATAVREATCGGVEFAFETAGATAAFDLALRITRRGGMTVTAGLPHPDARVSLPHAALVVEDRTIRGSYMGSCVPLRDIPRYLELNKRGLLPVERVVTGRLSLDDLNTGLDRLASGEAARQLVFPWGTP
jgi:alcohol dehydrogenase